MRKRDVLSALLEARRDPERIGDFAILKSELAGSRARPEIEAQLHALPEACPRVDLQALARLPRGTLGREYAEMLEANGLQPFRISGALDPEIVRRNIFTARYSLTHDVFHVITGFDTSWAGELGVWAFVAAQNYARSHLLAVFLACLLYPVLSPRQIPDLVRNLRRGWAMGKAADPLVTVPWEQLWDQDVDLLRHRFDVQVSATAGAARTRAAP